MKLGVNVDHVATLRQARKAFLPDPVEAALVCEAQGADSIVCHLREDRRHINDEDVRRLRKAIKTRLNLEMSIDADVVSRALEVKPDEATLVPEKRQEITTEGGLDLINGAKRLAGVIKRLRLSGIVVSLFIDPVKEQIKLAKELAVEFVELHTGLYAEAKTAKERQVQLDKLIEATKFALELGLGVNAGHGLNYTNVQAVSRISGIEELNIGHSIMARAIIVGMAQAVREMKELIQ